MDVQYTEGSSGIPRNVPSVMMTRGGARGGGPAESSQVKFEPFEQRMDGFDHDDADELGAHRMGNSTRVAGGASGPLALPHGAGGQLDKDFLCPICMEAMRDAFLTACGHSFCYSCITTHLNHKLNCPCCAQFLTQEQIFPNFALNKLLKKAAASQLISTASPSQHLRVALQQGAELSVKELDSLLQLLSQKRRRVEQEEAEMNMDILTDFLQRSREKKQAELDEVMGGRLGF